MCKCSTALNFARHADSWHLTESFSLFSHSILSIDTDTEFEMFSIKGISSQASTTWRAWTRVCWPACPALKMLRIKISSPADSVHKSHIHVTITIPHTKKCLFVFLIIQTLVMELFEWLESKHSQHPSLCAFTHHRWKAAADKERRIGCQSGRRSADRRQTQ